MALNDKKITAYANPVANLPDHPSSEGWSAASLKAAFDANATGEIKDAINGIIDELTGANGAENIGATELPGLSGATVKEQITNLKNQINDVVLGQIPDNSLTEAKISNDVKVSAKANISENYLSAHNIPSTAKRGKVDVKSKGLSAVNRIKNGNFAINDKTFWETSGYSSSFDIIDNVAKTTDYTASNRGFITKQMPVNSTDKYYCRFRTKVDNLDKLSYFRVLNGLLMGDGYLQYELATGWNTLSGIHTFTAGKQLRFFYSFIDVGTYPAYLDNVSFINLTTLFGAGNEPTKEQCDLMFANYFDGLQGASNIEVRSEDSTGEIFTEVQYKTLDGQPITLHRLPNGVRDEITSDGKLIKRIGEKTLIESDIISMWTSHTKVDYARFNKPTDYKNYNTYGHINNCIIGTYNPAIGIVDSTESIGNYYADSDLTTFFIGFAEGTTLATAKTALAGTKLIYELSTPQIIDTNATPLIAEPNGHVFITSEGTQPSVELEYPLNIAGVINGLIEGQKELTRLVQSLL